MLDAVVVLAGGLTGWLAVAADVMLRRPARGGIYRIQFTELQVTLDQDQLDALDGLGSSGIWEVFGRQLRLTNLDKVLFPPTDGQPPVTKREFIRYAAAACASRPRRES